MTMMPAARVGDDIAHSNAGMGMLMGILAGAAVGAVLVAATVATGGLALVAAAGAAAGMVSAGGLGGMYIGEASMGPPCGKFVVGSPNVFINGKPATFTAGSMASCSKDGGNPIPLATGSSSVFINTGMAGRKDEKIGCSAKSVPQVSPNVFIGGESAQDPRVQLQPEVPGWAVTALQVLGIAGAIAALPFAIASVGVAATIGGAVLGFAGAIGGAAGGRALGEALGLSEAGIRSLEVAGGFLGGMVGGAAGTKGTQAFNRNYQIKVDPNALGMNGGNVRIVPRTTPAGGPTRGPDGRFVSSGQTPSTYNRSSQYPSGYRAGVVDDVLDANTIQRGPNAGKIRTADGDIVARDDPRLTIEHNKPVVEHWNETGYNSNRATRNDFYNDTGNMGIRLRGPNSADGGRMSASGIRYRQDIGPDFQQ